MPALVGDEIIELPQGKFSLDGLAFFNKCLILSFCDPKSRSSLMSTSRVYSDIVIFERPWEEYAWEDYTWEDDMPSDEREERDTYVKGQMHRSVVSYLLHMDKLPFFLPQEGGMRPRLRYGNANVNRQPSLSTPLQILENIQYPRSVSIVGLVRAQQTQILKAQFIVATLPSVILDKAIRDQNPAMLGLLLANRFVKRTMLPLWEKEFKQSAITRRTVLMVILNALLNVVLHWGLITLGDLGAFNFISETFDYIDNSLDFLIAVIESSGINVIIQIILGVITIFFLLFTFAISFACCFWAIYVFAFFVKDCILYGLFLPASTFVGFIRVNFTTLLDDSLISAYVTFISLFLLALDIYGFMPIFLRESKPVLVCLCIFISGMLNGALVGCNMSKENVGISPLIQKILLSFPVTVLCATLALPFAVLVQTLLVLGASVSATAWLARYLLAMVFASPVIMLSLTTTITYQSIYSEFKKDMTSILSFFYSINEQFFNQLWITLYPKIDWDRNQNTFLVKNLSKYPASEAMLNLARTVSIAESVAEKVFTPNEHANFLLRKHLPQPSRYCFFGKNDTKNDTAEISFLRSLLANFSNSSIAEIDFQMDKYKSNALKGSVSQEFEALSSYIQYVLLPMEERQTFREAPSLRALYERVPAFSFGNDLKGLVFPTSYPVAA